MRTNSKNIFIASLLALSLIVTACGGNSKKKDSGSDDSAVQSVDNNQDVGSGSQDIAVNSDSDSGKAGPLQSVYFPFNSSSITSNVRNTLNNNATFLKNNTNIKIELEGHCDERGSVQYNLALGEKRAKSVRDYLVAMGVSSSRISTISFGKERPVSFGHDDMAWSRNRRANFVVTAK